METEEKLRKLVSEQIEIQEDQIKPESHFIDDLSADSLDMIEFVLVIENEFDIEILDEEIEDMDAFGKQVEYVEKKLSDQMV